MVWFVSDIVGSAEFAKWKQTLFYHQFKPLFEADEKCRYLNFLSNKKSEGPIFLKMKIPYAPLFIFLGFMFMK